MENDDFIYTIKLASEGDQEAIDYVLKLFSQDKIPAFLFDQIHFYLKTQRSHEAVYFRGLLYKHGYGVKQDYDMSFLLMRDAAAKGNAKATYEIGDHFMHGLGVERDYVNAMQWLSMAAGSPYYISEAMYDLGIIYEQGLGVELNKAQSQNWFQKAADKGYILAKEKLIKGE